MIGKESLQAFGIFLKISSFLRLNTYVWLSKEDRVITAASPVTTVFCHWKISRLGFKIVTLIIFGNFGFGATRIVNAYLFAATSFQDLMFQVFTLSVSFLCCILTFFMVEAMDDLGWLITVFLRHEKFLTGTFS